MNVTAPLRLFLGGDVMTGRGIDQILRVPSQPELYESFVRDARTYVSLAEGVSGPIPRAVSETYVWGDLLPDLAAARPDLRIVNLETAITRSDDAEPKGIHYRMHPANAGVLASARIDACILANNHVLDWGRAGLGETLATLADRGIAAVGAGLTEEEAWKPHILTAGGGRRLVILACAAGDSGVPHHWAAGPDRAGIALLPDPPEHAIERMESLLADLRRPEDAVILSVHWAGNWGHDVPAWQRDFARATVDRCGVDVVFGHSSHHPKAIERHRGALIMYGCGDLLNDYEGIGGRAEFLTRLVPAYLVDVDAGKTSRVACRIRPYRIERFRLHRSSAEDFDQFVRLLSRECARHGTQLTREPTGELAVA
jgi:poly-gamma-glutamate capsule biosynthesis protein CapA/YwtB (metallophosphatase superfamily)